MISLSFEKVGTSVESFSEYTDIQEIYPHLWRARKGGKFFILKGANGIGERDIALLQREYEISAPLSHPNLVSVLAFEEIPELGRVIVMEYVDGVTLREFLDDAQNRDNATKRRIFEQLLDVVSYIHRTGLIHNDLKPENILVTAKDHDVKLLDFGFADNDSNYLEKTLGRTKDYASPELENSRISDIELDTKSDIYSLGLIMKDLFGRKYRRISNKCTRTNREKRYENTDTLKRAWRRRNLPLKTCTAIILAVLILLPSILYYRQKQRAEALFENTSTMGKMLDSLKTESVSLSEYEDAKFTLGEKLMADYEQLMSKYKTILNDAFVNFSRSKADNYLRDYPNYSQIRESLVYFTDKEIDRSLKSHIYSHVVENKWKPAAEKLASSAEVMASKYADSLSLSPSRRQDLLVYLRNISNDYIQHHQEQFFYGFFHPLHNNIER